jgi:hypothetical protein
MQPQAQETRAQESQPQEQPPRVQQPPPAASTVRTRTRRKTDWSHRKALLLPEITQFALEGQSGRSIARRLDLPVRTVNYWLKELRRQWLAAANQTSAEMMSVELARLNGIYREAMEAWRKSEGEVQAWLDEQKKKAGEDGAANDKKPPRRNTELLRGALAAVRAVRDFLDRAARRAAPVPAQPGLKPRPASDLHSLTEEELLALEAQCGLLGKDGPGPGDRPHPGPLPAGEGNGSEGAQNCKK